MGWKSWAPAVGSAVGSVFGGPAGGAAGAAFGQNIADEENTAQANKAAKQRQKDQEKFQERMSNTARQREMLDLKNAGLNPLSAAGGTGASTPSGGMATTFKSDAAKNFGDNLRSSIATAFEGKRLNKDLEQASANISLTKASELTQGTQQQLNTQNAVKAQADAARANLENEALKSRMPSIAKKAEYEQKKAELDTRMLGHDAVMNRARTWTGTVSDAVGAFMPKIKVLGPSKKPLRNRGTDRVIDRDTGEILQESPRHW